MPLFARDFTTMKKQKACLLIGDVQHLTIEIHHNISSNGGTSIFFSQ